MNIYENLICIFPFYFICLWQEKLVYLLYRGCWVVDLFCNNLQAVNAYFAKQIICLLLSCYSCFMSSRAQLQNLDGLSHLTNANTLIFYDGGMFGRTNRKKHLNCNNLKRKKFFISRILANLWYDTWEGNACNTT